MIAEGWRSLARLFLRALSGSRRPWTQPRKHRRNVPGLESLEPIALLSTGGIATRLHHPGHHRLAARHVSRIAPASDVAVAASVPVVLPSQTLTLTSTLTNFADLPLSPALDLFDPSLGTLTNVTVSHSAIIQGDITSQNLSPTSPTSITASVSGSYSIDGLNQAIAQPTRTVMSEPILAGEFGSPTDTVVFPPVLLTDSASVSFTDASSLAFFTASAGRATITPTMTATASASASAPNGNLRTVAETTASSTVTITYSYFPPCPTPVKLGRIGVHHQRTRLILSYSGIVNPTLAEDPDNYSVIRPGGGRIAIVSASYDPATNRVMLLPERRLNVHHRFRLSVKLACSDAASAPTVRIPFGGRSSLIGFFGCRGQFIPVRDGRIVRPDRGSRRDHRPGTSERSSITPRPSAFPRRPAGVTDALVTTPRASARPGIHSA
jgi:hypothetical protein